MSSLSFLHLIAVPINDQGLPSLYGMQHLQSLYLDDTDTTDAGLAKLLEALPHLHLHINQNHIDRDPNKHEHWKTFHLGSFLISKLLSSHRTTHYRSYIFRAILNRQSLNNVREKPRHRLPACSNFNNRRIYLWYFLPAHHFSNPRVNLGLTH